MVRGRDVLRRLKVAGQARLARHGIVADIHRRGAPQSFTFVEASGRHYPVDFAPEWIETIEQVAPLTLTSPERLAALCSATEYIVRNDVPGGFVECGVWRGGSMMAAAMTLRRLGGEQRELHLFDTYTGATEPSEMDVNFRGWAIVDDWPPPEHDRADAIPRTEVEAAVASTGYDRSLIHCVEGDVLETLPEQAPSQIALLRLDTDFYESTLHELVHLYPRLVPGGVLIVDDYGHWEGARRAVDEYFADTQVFLARIDYSGRVAVKQSSRK
jgi:O-methyltransferase